MNRRIAIGVLVVGVLLAGAIFVWMYYRLHQRKTTLSSPNAFVQVPRTSGGDRPQNSKAQVLTPDDNSRLDFAVNGIADLLVTDPVGKRVGFDPVSGTHLQEIPGAAYWSDGLNNDTAGKPSDNWSNFLEISTPEKGVYKITISSADGGSFSLSEDVVSQDGSLQPEHSLSGTIKPGSQIDAATDVIIAPGSSSTLYFR